MTHVSRIHDGRGLRRGLGALALGFALLPAPFASATVVAGLDREALVRGADGIYAGVVRSIRAVPGPAPGPEILTRIEIEVTQAFKALPEAAAGSLVLLQTGGTLRGKTLHVHGQAHFAVAEPPVLVFVERLVDGRLMPYGMAQGKFTLEDKGTRVLAVRELNDLTFATGGPGARVLGPADPLRFPLRFELSELEGLMARTLAPSPAQGDLR